MIINIEGIPGSGKTTMVKDVVKKYDIQAVYEPVKNNPFLDKYYDDPKRYAFVIQMWLLAKRNAANKAAFWLSKAGVDVAVDRGRLGDRCFARVNTAMNNMTEDELNVYEEHFQALGARDPDVIAFLDLDENEALGRIADRGRACETAIDAGYLRLLRWEHLNMVNDARDRGVRVLISPTVEALADTCGLKKLAQKSA